MKPTTRVYNITMGRVSVLGRKAPLAPGGWHDYIGDLPESVKDDIGAKKLRKVILKKESKPGHTATDTAPPDRKTKVGKAKKGGGSRAGASGSESTNP